MEDAVLLPMLLTMIHSFSGPVFPYSGAIDEDVFNIVDSSSAIEFPESRENPSQDQMSTSTHNAA